MQQFTRRTVVVLDDVRNKPFTDEEDGLTIRTSEECLSFLGHTNGSRTHINELWLDFDLGGVFGQTELFDTAMPVALYLAELAFYGAPYPVDKIVIHTMNPVGRHAMGQLLRRFGYNVEDRVADFHI